MTWCGDATKLLKACNYGDCLQLLSKAERGMPRLSQDAEFCLMRAQSRAALGILPDCVLQDLEVVAEKRPWSLEYSYFHEVRGSAQAQSGDRGGLAEMDVGSRIGSEHSRVLRDRAREALEWFDNVQRDGLRLQQAPDHLLENRKLVLEAVQSNGRALQYAAEDLRRDKEVVLAAVQQEPTSLEFADPSIRKDRYVASGGATLLITLFHKKASGGHLQAIRCVGIGGDDLAEISPDEGCDIAWFRATLAERLETMPCGLKLLSAEGRLLEDGELLSDLFLSTGSDALARGLVEKISTGAGLVEKALAIFKSWDTDETGTISSDELSRALLSIDPSLDEETIDAMFVSADLNVDGIISYEEFVAWAFGSSNSKPAVVEVTIGAREEVKAVAKSKSIAAKKPKRRSSSPASRSSK
eukprot:TRINITY_DN28904_c0_g1_i1.p1 TRINITY_DN28904_c0_g1~~TRINITY_DN28904_c0_g1_i1.p1  ORF type:complete len:413 (-),score=70.82 TRINITY_DN28904_c0_g1_i1:47-1285(-)